VFATNRHLCSEYDKTSGLRTGPHKLKEYFPSHADLTCRYTKDMGIDLGKPKSALLFTVDSPAYPKSRYYQVTTNSKWYSMK